MGAFAVDLFGRDVQTGRPAIIENQLEATDHSHLGQLLAYAAGLKASTIIWVSPRFRDEHREALRWLNEVTDEDTGFFGVEVDILDINGQRAANFKLAAEPNTWQKATSATGKGREPGAASERMVRYQAFFAELLGELKRQAPSATTASKTQPQSWFTLAAGVSSCVFAWAFTRDRRFKVELTVDQAEGERNRQIMEELQLGIELLIDGVPEPLEWDLSPARRAQRVAVFFPQPLTIDASEDELAAAQTWGVERMKRFIEHFRPALRELLA